MIAPQIEEFHDADYRYSTFAVRGLRSAAVQGAIDHYIDRKIPEPSCGMQL
jgi:hypothetical protein